MSWFSWRRSSRDPAPPMLVYATTADADAAKARAAAAGLEPRIGSLVKDGARYIIFRGGDTERAKQYLLDEFNVTEELYYYVVETPNGNWGKDIDGLYLENLLSWQFDPTTAECSGVIVSVGNVNGIVAAANGRVDNFVVTVRCGRCAHEWLDGVRYREITAAQCPSCAAVNAVDSTGVVLGQHGAS